MSIDGIRLRLLTAVLVVVPLAGIIFLAPVNYGTGLLALITLAGAWEWAGFFSSVTRARRIAMVLIIGVGLASAWFAGSDAILPILGFAMGWWLIAFVWLLRFPTPIPSWLILLGSFLVLIPGWLALSVLQQGYRGPQWLTFFLLVIIAADSGAYFTGKTFGHTRLAPKVSPGKTWEGAGGGLLFVTIVALFGAHWFDLSMIYLVTLCLAVSLASIVGDLTISMFKRHAGLKDSGRLFPGHGGVLDRIDSISAGAPLFVIGLSWSDHII